MYSVHFLNLTQHITFYLAVTELNVMVHKLYTGLTYLKHDVMIQSKVCVADDPVPIFGD